jgi:ParB family chromosome partitioning protein
MQQPKKLGRGLGGLIGINTPVQVEVPLQQALSAQSASEKPQVIATSSDPNTPSVRYIPVAKIIPSPYQPRKIIDEEAIARLSESIKRAGVMQPIIVREKSGMYELVVGERRWRATRHAGLEVIPALVKELSEETAAEWSLVENVQREDLNPMERGWALRALAEKFSLTQSDVADRVGLERSSVTNLIRLTDIESEIADLINKGELGLGHGKALLGLPSGVRRVETAQNAAKNGWSVRKLEEEIRAVAESEKLGKDTARQEKLAGRQAVVTEMERRIADYLGTKVRIATDSSGKKGKITFDFYGLEHFEGLLTRMGVPER